MENREFEEKTTDGNEIPEVASDAPVATKKEKKRLLPQIHLTKRDGVSLREAIIVRALAILAALIVCAIMTVIIETHV